MLLDWHPDLRTRCNLALLEYLKTSTLPDVQVLVLNIEGSEFYLLYSECRLVCFGDYLHDHRSSVQTLLFEVGFRTRPEQSMRFCLMGYHEVAFRYEALPYGIQYLSAYLLDDQPPGEVWKPAWGVPVLRSETEDSFSDYTSVVETRPTEDGVVCEFMLLDENGEHPEFENALFIPFDYRTPPAPNAVGCEVDGTFFLLFNDLQKERHP